MDQELEVVAKNENEAVKKALEEASLDAEQVETEVESLGKSSKGILGLVSSKDRKFLVRIKQKEETEGDVQEEPEEPGRIKEAAAEFLKRTLGLMNISATIENVEEDEDAVRIELEGEDSGILIGRRGQTLSSLQYLLNIAMYREVASHKRVVLDVEGYRARQASELESLAGRIAAQAIERKESIALRPMTAYERRIVHMALQDNEEVETLSEGEDPDRRVLIVPKG